MTITEQQLERSIGPTTAAAVVVANMIGAGIFTTTGFQAADLGNPVTICALWVVGGLLALCGALCYGELGAAMPRAGGEYVYLREAFGGSFAFMSALVSLTAGFSAPIASALLSLARYLGHYLPFLNEHDLIGGLSSGHLLAIVLVWVLVAVHCRRTAVGMNLINALTLLKVGGIVAILLCGIALGRGEVANLTRVAATAPSGTRLYSGMGTSLIFIMFCYSGWNAASYLAGEIRRPGRDLPRALLAGTALVTGLYLALNVLYFYGAGVDELAGKVEVALVASQGLFGPVGAAGVTATLTVSLLAAASVMTAVGPRVYFAAGRDLPALRFLHSVSPSTGAPTAALIVQGVTTTLFIVLGTVDQIQQYAGFTLILFATLAVACVIVLRIRRPLMDRPFRAWGYPVTPLLFIAVSLWMMFWACRGRPVESALGMLTVGLGGLAHLVLARRNR